AASLARSGRPGEAAAQLDRLLQESPWVIDDGELLANTYRQTGRIDELVERVLTLKPTQRLSVQPQAAKLEWLGQMASTLASERYDLALRLYRRQRELLTKNAEQIGLMESILDLLLASGSSQDLLQELEHFGPRELQHLAESPLA